MPTLRQLRTRVRSLKNTQQITRAMKMIAGARIRRAEQAMKAARPYSQAIAGMLSELLAAGGSLDHPLLRVRPARRAGILVLTADKGLAGAFNSNLVRAALSEAAASAGGNGDLSRAPQFYVVGAKGGVQLRRTPYEKAAYWPLGGPPFSPLAVRIAQQISGDFMGGRIDAVTLVSSRFLSTIVQRPARTQLLPVTAPQESAQPEKPGMRNAFEFEPDAGIVLAELLPKYLEFTIFQALLETQASEFAARLLAMTNATDNAGKLIDDLTIVMNKTRQASITKEILEISGGAEALKR